MATDWIFYWKGQAFFLIFIGLAIAGSFHFWHVILGEAFRRIGFAPLLLGYSAAALGLLIILFAATYTGFSNRVSRGVFQEEQRWSIVPVWTAYHAELSLFLILPILFLIMPLPAILLRKRKLTYVNTLLSAGALWSMFALLVSLINRKEGIVTAFFTALKETLPGVVLPVVVPFLLGIFVGSRSFRKAES